jgi:hypothetical protein
MTDTDGFRETPHPSSVADGMGDPNPPSVICNGWSIYYRWTKPQSVHCHGSNRHRTTSSVLNVLRKRCSFDLGTLQRARSPCAAAQRGLLKRCHLRPTNMKSCKGWHAEGAHRADCRCSCQRADACQARASAAALPCISRGVLGQALHGCWMTLRSNVRAETFFSAKTEPDVPAALQWHSTAKAWETSNRTHPLLTARQRPAPDSDKTNLCRQSLSTISLLSPYPALPVA